MPAIFPVSAIKNALYLLLLKVPLKYLTGHLVERCSCWDRSHNDRNGVDGGQDGAAKFACVAACGVIASEWSTGDLGFSPCCGSD